MERRFTLQAHAVPLLNAGSNRAELESAYSHFLEAVLGAPLWSTQQADGLRVPWRSGKEASAHTSLRDAFNSPGLYLFGSDAGVPLYLGKTATTLWKRLGRRYVRGKRSQCQLAVDYEQELLARGIDGFPDDVRGWYRKQYGTSTVRLQGAVTFARHGIEGIWFTLIPIKNTESVDPLEQSLIPVADAWNRSRGYPALLNVHYASS